MIPPNNSSPHSEILARERRVRNRATPARAIIPIALAALALCGAARAADPKPDFAIKTKVIEASVLLDDKTILWDTTARKRISIRPFFTETADDGATMKAVQTAIIAALKTEKKKRDIEENAEMDWYKGVEPKLLKIGAVTLAPSTEANRSSGLTFHYPPYAVGSYAEGDYVAFIPWEKLKPYLTLEGAAIFGGARPKGDEKGDDDQQ